MLKKYYSGKCMRYLLNSKAFYSLLWAQFLSALGDNAIFIAAIALIKRGNHADLLESFLQAAFLVAYIVLAPYVGPFADGFAKSRVMLISNTLKLLGAIAMAFGLNPVLGYSIIGVGAAMYSPAKYGILAEMFSADSLVRANGFLEGSTIVAILLGVTVGGSLSDASLHILFLLCILTYFAAGICNFFIPYIAPQAIFSFGKLKQYTKNYRQAFIDFIRKPAAAFSLLGTTTFWSVGTVLRLLLFSWVPFMFANNSNTLPATLMGALSVGIVFGATSAGIWIDLKHVKRVIVPGFLLGVFTISVVFIHHLILLYILMIALGFCGGMFAVPLNALVQETGYRSVGSGVALAFQNFCENSGMLIFTLLYSLLIHLHMPLPWIVVILGLFVIVIISKLGFKRF